MPLAAPTGLTVTRLRAVGEDGFSVSGSYFPGPREISIYGLVQWTNSESAEHTVEVVTGCSTMCHISTWNQKTILPKGTNTADVLLAKFYSSVLQGYQPANISVQLRGASGDSTATTTTKTVDLSSITTPVFSTSMAVAFGTSLTLPVWDSVLWKPTLTISNESGESVLTYDLSRITSDKVTIPSSLVAGKNYKAVLQGRPDFERKVDYVPEGAFSFYQILPSGLGVQSLVFAISSGTYPFSVFAKSVRVIKNEQLRIRLDASHPSTFEIVSGAPAGFAIERTLDASYLVGTPIELGVSSVVIRGTRTSDSTQTTATVSITVVAGSSSVSGLKIIVNPGWLNNGLAFNVGDRVTVQLASLPSSGVAWMATGLPPGLVIDPATGLISGTATTQGRFMASVVASARVGNSTVGSSDGGNFILPKLEESLPAQITFTIRASATGGDTSGGGTIQSNPALTRIPWILSKWTLTDLQVFARIRAVQSTLIDSKSAMRLKVGDNINFAVFFIGSDDRPFALDPSRLRVTIRPDDNLESALVFDSKTSPAAVTTEPDPYYLLAASTAGRERQIVQEWVEDTGKNEPLPCVADVDWTKDGQHFSSASFPVLLELDVTRP